LSENNTNPSDDSVREAISILLTPGQLEQFENYRREEALLAETKTAERKSEQRLKTLFSKSESNKVKI
ncbi:MAG: hypothetical protein LBM04_05495, partial [Opitutaceae bacterium]|nr:hypothetical protein [Opitutaceae bacterium]